MWLKYIEVSGAYLGIVLGAWVYGWVSIGLHKLIAQNSGDKPVSELMNTLSEHPAFGRGSAKRLARVPKRDVWSEIPGEPWPLFLAAIIHAVILLMIEILRDLI